MTPESGHVLRHIESLGYAVSIHRMDGYVELHAVNVRPGGAEEPVHIVRVDGISDGDVYVAACELAGMVGIDLEG